MTPRAVTTRVLGVPGLARIATTRNELTLTCWPVGQGLFTECRLRFGGREFFLVYDCGAFGWRGGDGPKIIQEQTDPQLDILVISHLHEDHTNGLRDLITKRRPRAVWLPGLAPEVHVVYSVVIVARGIAEGAPTE